MNFNGFKKAYLDRSSKERGSGGVRITMMTMIVMMPGIRSTPSCRLLRLDRHRRTGLSFPLPKPVPVHAKTTRNYITLDNFIIVNSSVKMTIDYNTLQKKIFFS